jgi:hypothetical protein|tara:strand:- start:844 stop:1299 length:456 start_codon:yes stop_codon:yes gene_type:complete
MNINKKFLILLIFILQLFSINFVSHGDETLDQENQENKEKSIDLDDEELPAIDPFQSSSAGTSGTSLDGISGITDEGLLNGLKLVGVIIGKSKKIAVLSTNDGIAINFEENDNINDNIELQEIYNDHLLIKDKEEKFYEVYMNDIIKTVER